MWASNYLCKYKYRYVCGTVSTMEDFQCKKVYGHDMLYFCFNAYTRLLFSLIGAVMVATQFVVILCNCLSICFGVASVTLGQSYDTEAIDWKRPGNHFTNIDK